LFEVLTYVDGTPLSSTLNNFSNNLNTIINQSFITRVETKLILGPNIVTSGEFACSPAVAQCEAQGETQMLASDA